VAKKKATKRNYRKEYDNFDSKPSEIKKRSNRNKARRKLKKAGVKVAGKDVHHKDGNANNNKKSNLTTKSPSKNRSFARTKKAGKKRTRVRAMSHKGRKK